MSQPCPWSHRSSTQSYSLFTSSDASHLHIVKQKNLLHVHAHPHTSYSLVGCDFRMKSWTDMRAETSCLFRRLHLLGMGDDGATQVILFCRSQFTNVKLIVAGKEDQAGIGNRKSTRHQVKQWVSSYSCEIMCIYYIQMMLSHWNHKKPCSWQ